ncbi:unnamed protein product [Linum trigynum]
MAKQRNDLVPSSTIIFLNSPSISDAATSFISSLMRDTDSMQRSMSSSGFQFTQPSHGSLPCLLPPSRGSAAPWMTSDAAPPPAGAIAPRN